MNPGLSCCEVAVLTTVYVKDVLFSFLFQINLLNVKVLTGRFQKFGCIKNETCDILNIY